MRGYTTDYVNLIADNLRDRYQNGFPILKELIQNADDAKARGLIFGKHSGFPNTDHPLLRGPGLWVFNDGVFTESDAENLRSFGISGRAGDSHVIGKFGLGMKSVFHLCEALFYVAKDKDQIYCEGLSPWITDSNRRKRGFMKFIPERRKHRKKERRTLHEEWDEISQSDWNYLKDLGKKLADDSSQNRTWFLLWLPLRKREHLQTSANEEMGCIISRFPGDDPNPDLEFLYDERLAYDMAEILPLLRHLGSIEHKGEKNSFVLELSVEQRLLASCPRTEISGEVQLSGRHQPLDFSGLRDMSEDSCFKDMRNLETWPSTRYRDELGRVCYASDRSKPEAAVLFYSRPSSEIFFHVHWAVFLPVEDHAEELESNLEKRTYSLALHGQFFLDAGRKKIHDFKHLHDEPKAIDKTTIDERLLRRAWNQRLAQMVLLPLVLPALQLHVKNQKLSERECTLLTEDIQNSKFFTRFQKHICENGTWLRTLQRDAAPQWRLVKGDCCSRLRPLPNPPKSDPKRPWQVFPKLSELDVHYDVDATYLSSRRSPGEWQKEELDKLLTQVNGLFGDATYMEYLIRFLDSCVRKEQRNSGSFQPQLLDMMRIGLLNSERAKRRKVATRGRRLVGMLDSEMRLEIATNLPESILKKLWKIDAPLLLVPNGMDSEPQGKAYPDKKFLLDWLNILAKAFNSAEIDGKQELILGAIQGLLQALSDKKRRNFLQEYQNLQIIKVQDARNGADNLLSVIELNQRRDAGTLFRYAGGLRSTRMGITPLLARAIPHSTVCLIRSDTCRDIFVDAHAISDANDEQACLAAVGKYSNQLGGIAERRDLLVRANNPGTDFRALLGLRFLLHGSLDNREDDNTQLWVGRHRQHPAWSRLWENTHRERNWSLISSELVDVVPRNCWQQANIAEIDAETLIEMLSRERATITNPEEFSPEERNEILSKIQDKNLWRRLPLHWAVNRCLVSVTSRVYLVDEAIDMNEPLACEATFIRLSDNVDVANRQRLWIRPLDHVARIEIALGNANPGNYWREIMDAVNELHDDIPGCLIEQLRDTVWLPTNYDDTIVRPRDVIDFREGLEDEAHLIVTRHRNPNRTRYAVPDELSAEVRAHNAWELIRDLGFSAEDEGLDLLAQLLEDLPDFRIGDWKEPPADYVIRLLAHNNDLPGWRLLERVANSFGLETAWAKLRQALSQKINIESLTNMLNWLAASGDEWNVRKSAHDSYLKQLACHGRRERIPTDFLRNLQLAAADNSWQNARDLCAGAHGVVAENLLDRHQKRILGNLICNANAGGHDEDRRQNNGEFEENPVDDALCTYFETWDANLVPRPMIGLVLALLGSNFRQVAEEYLNPHSFGWLVGKLPWRDPGFNHELMRMNRMGGSTADEALNLINASVEVHSGDTVRVFNLLCENIDVPIEQELTTLLTGDFNWQYEFYVQLEHNVQISLRSINPHQYDPEKLRKLLRATAESLYMHLYEQNTVDFDDLWKELDQSHQLEIGVARRLILDNIPFYLRQQFSVRCEAIEQHLRNCKRLRYEIAEVEKEITKGKMEIFKAEKKIAKAETEINKAKTEINKAKTEIAKAENKINKEGWGVGYSGSENAEVKTEIDKAEAERDKAKMETDKAEKKIDRAKKEIDKAEKKVVKEKNKKKYKIRNLAENNKKWRDQLNCLANLIDGDQNVQKAVVEAVRDKLKQYQYDFSSIPFELFQNADDAAVELGQFHVYPSEGCQVPPEAQCFVVEEREDSVGFIHWGRPVNACGPIGFDGESRGYDSDLEKMLILSSTDKPYDEAVTGKFGLGFKSVLLACEQPRILSGHLAIRVVAGILPEIWVNTDEARERLRCHSGENCRLPGTLIDLPQIGGEDRKLILARFQQLAGILCVFGRAIRTIKHVHSDAQDDSHCKWGSKKICPGVNLEIGDLELKGDWGGRTKALCVRTENGSVLMAIGPQGFRVLPDDVPALWVTAPTRESSAVGFAVNGDFDLDAGRGRLAGNPEKNLNKARKIGKSVGVDLGKLFMHSRNNWDSVQSELQLAKNLEIQEFWESIWVGLTKRNLRRDRGDGENLTREVAFAALTQLCNSDCPRVVPNGLKGPLRAFTDVNGIRYKLSEILRGEEIGKLLGNWQRFKIEYRGEACVSREIADILRNVDSLVCQLQPVDFFALVDLLENSRVDPKDAEVLGRLYLLTRGATDWKSDNLVEKLKNLSFRSENNEWIKSRGLLSRYGTDIDSDEPRRHSLAPPEHRLHPDYYVNSGDEAAVTFFKLCRQRMEARPEKIAGWVLAANSDEERRTALIYLAESEFGERVAEHVREEGWLLDVSEFPNLKEELKEEQLDKLHRRLITQLQVNQAVFQNGKHPPDHDDLKIAKVGLDVALNRLYEWWDNEDCELIENYRNGIFPNDLPIRDLAPETEPPHQPSWFLLLTLGSFQSIGRTKDGQHGKFIRLCRDKGWWQIFTECDPREQPERWMDVIEEYAGRQYEDEKWIQWLMQFPKLYRLRRWMDDYINLFLSINRFQRPFNRDTILAPKASSEFQGGGIDPPPLTRTLKVGFPFVVRELLYRGVVNNRHAVPHAYAPIERIRRFFRAFDEEIETSEKIHEILTEHLGEEKAKFNGAYDIPLRIVSASANASLRDKILL